MAATVIQSVKQWLPGTQTWLYTQMRRLEPAFDNVVYCRRVLANHVFPVDQLTVAPELPGGRYTNRGFRLQVATRRWGLRRLIRRSGAALVHSHFGTIAWMDHAVVPNDVGQVATFYGFDVNSIPRDPAWRRRYDDLFARVDRVLCEGPHMAQTVIDLGCPAEKMRVHALGVEVDRLPFEPRRWQPGQPLRVLMAASFREKKGLPYGLRALAALRRERPELELEITLIGDAGGQEDSYREKEAIMAAIDDGLGDVTRLLGYQPHDVLMAEAHRAHLFVSPSVHAADGDTEGGVPVTFIEMVATGLPVISTTHCDVPSVVHHGDIGRLAPERDVGALTKEIAWMLDHPEEWEAMAKRGRKHVEANYDSRVQGQRLAAIYEEVLAERR